MTIPRVLPPAPPLVLILVLLLSRGGFLSAETPSEVLWTGFISRMPDRGRLPEDAVLGLLADRRNSDSSWMAALGVCDRAFEALNEGRIPEKELAAALKVPLARELSSALESGSLSAGRRYGNPIRTGERLEVPVRLSSPEHVGYGSLYLVRAGGEWYLEQWALDLSPFTTGENTAEGESSNRETESE